MRVPSISRGVYCFCSVFLLAVAPGTVYPAGGSARTRDAATHMAMNETPNIMNVSGTPTSESMMFASGENITSENPKDPTIAPVAKPRLSGNHFCMHATVQEYTIPTPSPPINP